MSDSDSSYSSASSVDTFVTIKETKKENPITKEKTIDVSLTKKTPSENLAVESEVVKNKDNHVTFSTITIHDDKNPLFQIQPITKLPQPVRFLPIEDNNIPQSILQIKEESNLIKENIAKEEENIAKIENEEIKLPSSPLSLPENPINLESDKAILEEIEKETADILIKEEAPLPVIEDQPLKLESENNVTETSSNNVIEPIEKKEIITPPLQLEYNVEKQTKEQQNVLEIEKPEFGLKVYNIKDRFKILENQFLEYTKNIETLPNQDFKFKLKNTNDSVIKSLPNIDIKFNLLELFFWGFIIQFKEFIDSKFFDSLSLDQQLKRTLRETFSNENESVDFTSYQLDPIKFFTDFIWKLGMVMYTLPFNSKVKQNFWNIESIVDSPALLTSDEEFIEPMVFQKPGNIKILAINDALFGYFPNNKNVAQNLLMTLKWNSETNDWITQKPLFLRFFITMKDGKYSLYQKENSNNKTFKLTKKNKLTWEESKDFEDEPFVFVCYK